MKTEPIFQIVNFKPIGEKQPWYIFFKHVYHTGHLYFDDLVSACEVAKHYDKWINGEDV